MRRLLLLLVILPVSSMCQQVFHGTLVYSAHQHKMHTYNGPKGPVTDSVFCSMRTQAQPRYTLVVTPSFVVLGDYDSTHTSLLNPNGDLIIWELETQQSKFVKAKSDAIYKTLRHGSRISYNPCGTCGSWPYEPFTGLRQTTDSLILDSIPVVLFRNSLDVAKSIWPVYIDPRVAQYGTTYEISQYCSTEWVLPFVNLKEWESVQFYLFCNPEGFSKLTIGQTINVTFKRYGYGYALLGFYPGKIDASVEGLIREHF